MTLWRCGFCPARVMMLPGPGYLSPLVLVHSARVVDSRRERARASVRIERSVLCSANHGRLRSATAAQAGLAHAVLPVHLVHDRGLLPPVLRACYDVCAAHYHNARLPRRLRLCACGAHCAGAALVRTQASTAAANRRRAGRDDGGCSASRTRVPRLEQRSVHSVLPPLPVFTAHQPGAAHARLLRACAGAMCRVGHNRHAAGSHSSAHTPPRDTPR